MLGGSSIPLSCILSGQMPGSNVTNVFPTWTQLAGLATDGDVDAFSELLLKTSSCQASDERDRVFALLGLVQGAHLEGLIADYTETVEKVYIGIAAYFLIRHGQSNILKWATLSRSSLTWVPTWRPFPGWSARMENALRVPTDEFWATFTRNSSEFSTETGVLHGKTFQSHILPDHVCRASRAKPQSIADVLNTMRPRVLQNTGALLLRAYPVLQFNSAILKNAFGENDSAGIEFLLRPSTGMSIRGQGQHWGIFCAGQVSFGQFWSGCVELFDDWIVEVPNCDVFLHLKPRRLVPGLYRIASVCYLTLVTNIDIQSLTAMEGRQSLPFDDSFLLLRLLMFEPHQLLFLQSWGMLMERNDSELPSRAERRASLSALQLLQYSRWLEYFKLFPESPIGPVSAESSSIFQPELNAVSCYLDEWADMKIWDRITRILEEVEWFTYLHKLDAVRRNFLSDSTAPPLNAQQEDETYYSRVLDRHFPSRSEMCRALPQGARHVLQKCLDALASAIDKLELPGLTGETMYLGGYRLSETLQRLCKEIDTFITCDVEQVRAVQDKVFQEWTEFATHLRHMQCASAEYNTVRNKFIQRQVLRRLYTRCELREFLIS